MQAGQAGTCTMQGGRLAGDAREQTTKTRRVGSRRDGTRMPSHVGDMRGDRPGDASTGGRWEQRREGNGVNSAMGSKLGKRDSAPERGRSDETGFTNTCSIMGGRGEIARLRFQIFPKFRPEIFLQHKMPEPRRVLAPRAFQISPIARYVF